MHIVKVGRPLKKLIAAAYKARQPVLLVGKHGLGKSEIFKEVAAELKIEAKVIDLSIIEPVDLAGLPMIDQIEKVMKYAQPASLPSDKNGKGIILFEELNRVPKDLQAACLQICTERKFNSYELPDGWIPCAAVNPVTDEYDTDQLDAALMSRFMVVYIEADADEWIMWARANKVHEVVIAYLEKDRKAINDPDLSPRTLFYTSRFILSNQKIDDDTLLSGIVGLAGEKHGSAIFRMLKKKDIDHLTIKDILTNPTKSADTIIMIVEKRRTDRLSDIMSIILQYVKSGKSPSKDQHVNLLAFIALLPEQKQKEIRSFCKGCGFQTKK